MASASSKPGIKLKAVSISGKLNILNKYDKGYAARKNQKEIAKELCLPPCTLRTILTICELYMFLNDDQYIFI